MEVIPYPYENSLVALVRMKTSEHVENGIEQNELKEALQRGEYYLSEFQTQRKMIIEFLENKKDTEKSCYSVRGTVQERLLIIFLWKI